MNPIEIIKSGKEDIDDILTLLGEAKGDNLSSEEKAREGFIQGNINRDMILHFQSDPGIFIAKSSDQTAGVAIVSRGEPCKQGPAAELYRTVLNNTPGLTGNELFLYGPVTVKKEYRGQGILTLLLKQVCLELQDDFKLGAAFVDQTNEKSLQIHRHYPMDESGYFYFNEKKYSVFTFAPSSVLRFYL